MSDRYGNNQILFECADCLIPEIRKRIGENIRIDSSYPGNLHLVHNTHFNPNGMRTALLGLDVKVYPR